MPTRPETQPRCPVHARSACRACPPAEMPRELADGDGHQHTSDERFVPAAAGTDVTVEATIPDGSAWPRWDRLGPRRAEAGPAPVVRSPGYRAPSPAGASPARRRCLLRRSRRQLRGGPGRPPSGCSAAAIRCRKNLILSRRTSVDLRSGPAAATMIPGRFLARRGSPAGHTPRVGEAWGAVFACDPGAVRREADGVIPAGKHEQVQRLLLGEQPGRSGAKESSSMSQESCRASATSMSSWSRSSCQHGSDAAP